MGYSFFKTALKCIQRNFDICMYSRSYHHSEDSQHLYHPQEFLGAFVTSWLHRPTSFTHAYSPRKRPLDYLVFCHPSLSCLSQPECWFRLFLISFCCLLWYTAAVISLTATHKVGGTVLILQKKKQAQSGGVTAHGPRTWQSQDANLGSVGVTQWNAPGSQEKEKTNGVENLVHLQPRDKVYQMF